MGLLEPLNIVKQGTAVHFPEISCFDESEHRFNTVAVVRCRVCEQRFLFRLYLYTSDAIGSEVYPFPGSGLTRLLYQRLINNYLLLLLIRYDTNIRIEVRADRS